MKESIIWINKQGYGEFKWSSGNIYKGNYKNDLRNGYGEMYWTDGSIYKGNWVNGIQHGYGKMMFIDGTVNEGIFDHNVYQGPMGGLGVNPQTVILEQHEEDDGYVQPKVNSLREKHKPNFDFGYPNMKQLNQTHESEQLYQKNPLNNPPQLINQYRTPIMRKDSYEEDDPINSRGNLKYFIPPQMIRQKKNKSRMKKKFKTRDKADEDEIKEIMKIVRARKQSISGNFYVIFYMKSKKRLQFLSFYFRKKSSFS